ncbi:hypothetical protein CIB48_g7262 [Xylaria polymorpha]|nr:hypothetical protein CIB48_g7262 [Xylaria polymorpha]
MALHPVNSNEKRGLIRTVCAAAASNRRWANVLVQWTRVVHILTSYESAATGAGRRYSSATCSGSVVGVLVESFLVGRQANPRVTGDRTYVGNPVDLPSIHHGQMLRKLNVSQTFTWRGSALISEPWNGVRRDPTKQQTVDWKQQ